MVICKPIPLNRTTHVHTEFGGQLCVKRIVVAHLVIKYMQKSNGSQVSSHRILRSKGVGTLK